MRVGLFGGTFNPPHAEPLIHASDVALKYLGLDAVWWLVTPGNPIKAQSNLPDLQTRMKNCCDLVTNPRVLISDIEKELGTIRTYDTVKALQTRFPKTDFIWFSEEERISPMNFLNGINGDNFKCFCRLRLWDAHMILVRFGRTPSV